MHNALKSCKIGQSAAKFRIGKGSTTRFIRTLQVNGSGNKEYPIIYNHLRFPVIITRKKFNISKDELYDLYINQKLTSIEIGNLFDVHFGTVARYLHKYDIPIKAAFTTYEELYDLYINQELSTRDIAKLFSVAQTTVRRQLEKYNIPTRSSVEGKATKHYQEKLNQVAQRLTKNIEVECKQCHNIFITKPHLVKEFCSNRCRLDYNKANNIHYSTNYKHSVSRVVTHCAYCDAELERIPSRLKDIKHSFCNMTCLGKWRSENIVGENNPSYNRIETICGWCGKTLLVIPAVFNKNEKCYCNVQCMSEYYSRRFTGKNSPSWKGGKCKKDQYGDSWFRARRKTRERDNYTCQLCGVTETDLGQQMSVHHVIPFRNFDDYYAANNLDNLVCLCRYCHTFVHSNDNINNIFLNDVTQ